MKKYIIQFDDIYGERYEIEARNEEEAIKIACKKWRKILQATAEEDTFYPLDVSENKDFLSK